MKLSRKTDYALHALFTLVAENGGAPVPVRELAERNDAPKRFLEQILLEMKAAGWVESLPGKNGGYRLACAPAQITMGQVIRKFDGVLAPIGCVSVKRYEACSQEANCRFRRVLLDARNYVAELMDRADLESVFQGQIVSTAEVFADFGDGAGI